MPRNSVDHHHILHCLRRGLHNVIPCSLHNKQVISSHNKSQDIQTVPRDMNYVRHRHHRHHLRLLRVQWEAWRRTAPGCFGSLLCCQAFCRNSGFFGLLARLEAGSLLTACRFSKWLSCCFGICLACPPPLVLSQWVTPHVCPGALARPSVHHLPQRCWTIFLQRYAQNAADKTNQQCIAVSQRVCEQGLWLCQRYIYTGYIQTTSMSPHTSAMPWSQVNSILGCQLAHALGGI